MTKDTFLAISANDNVIKIDTLEVVTEAAKVYSEKNRCAVYITKAVWMLEPKVVAVETQL